ncbi:exodeoxyribonuclease VII large subunit [Allocatelliglobosispora scoriae]|uniref:Exodeoxyribonuclease 7 large subunit n=1 Tax=Allocatelliglobosispora scoriae TaxID=643052 RepID=A0A841BXZ5_9ACTN|nr:exodeoxyribonuclease VII large subunit [Allocatelliglobosispora scoriae]MBB5871652.1 exodeoxyribonuclease VII large subunit [Allocatelliglobosispora scoriae]
MTSSPEEPWPVRRVSQSIGQWIGKLGSLWVDAQIAQISRRPGSSTVFLTLRDPSADISLTATATRDVLDSGAPDLQDGARVVVHGKPDFYPARGTLSLRIDEIRQIGEGELKAQIEKLRLQLQAEGLFDPRRKRRPPFLPNRIGLITGRASAAERDVLTNAKRRWPAIDFRVINVAVQGAGSVPEIVTALKQLDLDATIDVIILARGGGSFEDLLPFSNEALCRAVFACSTPVISAIGHEPDTPLVDYVADLRASTPTDAAKRVVPDVMEEVRLIGVARGRLNRAIRNRVDREQQRITSMRSRPSLARPHAMLDRMQGEVTAMAQRARRHLDHRLTRADGDLAHVLARLRALSPAATLGRGYAIVQADDGRVLRDAATVGAGDALRVRLAEGELRVTVSE